MPAARCRRRSEEHTSELQSRQYLVCRLLLEKKKQTGYPPRSRSKTSAVASDRRMLGISSISTSKREVSWRLSARPAAERPSCFFFFNDTAATEIYTLSLHDALPI